MNFGKKELVSVIIPVYNGEKCLVQLIDSLKKQTYDNLEIITVDNNSIDNSLNLLKSLNENINLKIIQNKKNEGYSGGCNRGFNIATGDYILFLSQDRMMNDNWIEKTVSKIKEDKKIGCVIGKVIIKGASSPEFGHAYDIFGAVLINGIPNEINLFFGGGTILFKKKILDEFGCFDIKFFGWQEDVDICWRIRLAGYLIRIEKDAICYGDGVGISDTFIENGKYHITLDSELINMSLIRFYYSQRNRIRTLLKNYSTKNILKRLPITILIIILRGIYMTIKNKNISYFLSVFKGFFWNLLQTKDTLNLRKKIQNTRILDEKEIEMMMIQKSVELEGMKKIIKQFFKKKDQKKSFDENLS